MRYLYIFLTSLLVSCSTTELINNPKEISFKSIKANNNSSYEGLTTLVINTQPTFTDAWEKVWMRFSDVPTMPEINFEDSQIILVALGMRNNGGYTLEIEKVMEEKDKIIVHYFENRPGEKCNTTQAIVFPSEFIQIPKSSKKIEFKSTARIVECK